MSIVIGTTSFTDGINAEIVPISGAGALGVNYTMALSPTDASGMARVVYSYAIKGRAAGLLPDLHPTNLIAVHYFAAPGVVSPLDASVVGQWAGTAIDLMPNRAAIAPYTYMSTVHIAIDTTKTGFVQAAEGAAIEGDISVDTSVASSQVACLGSLLPSQRRGIVAVIIARDYLGDFPVQPLLLDWSCSGTSIS